MRKRREYVAAVVVLGLFAGCSSKTEPALDAQVAADRGVDRNPFLDASVDGRADKGRADRGKPDQGGSPSVWQAVPSEATVTIYGVGGSGPNVFAVGKAGTILRYKPTEGWVRETTSTQADLYAVYGVGDKAYAAGDGIILYFDGTSWTESYSSTWQSNFRGLWGVGGDMYVVADEGQIRKKGASATYWSSQTSSSSNDLNGIWGFAANDIYAVGNAGTILHYNGTKWAAMESNVSANLQGIWGQDPKSLFVVGLDGVILRYDGSKWNKVRANNSDSYFYAVWGSSPTDVWVVGQGIFKIDESVFHFNGSTWTKQPPPKPAALYSIWGASATEVHLVGSATLTLKGKP